MNSMAMRIIKWLSKQNGAINDNTTACLQRYVVLGYERMTKYLTLTTNNIVLHIIPREYNSDSHCRPGDICRASPMHSIDRPVGILSHE
jgi:hypothetical protein